MGGGAQRTLGVLAVMRDPTEGKCLSVGGNSPCLRFLGNRGGDEPPWEHSSSLAHHTPGGAVGYISPEATEIAP